MDFPDVAVVILNWNGKSYLEQFLKDVVRYSTPYRVVLADNASTDGSIEWTQTNCPEVEIVLNSENGGFAKGYNDALKQITAEYYLLLNSDVEVTENWIPPLLSALKDENVACVQPKVRSFHRKEYFEHAGAAGGFIDRFHYPFCRGRILYHVEKDLGQYDYSRSIFWTTGACMLIKRDIYWEAGGLDERFFAHMEEIDLCWRIQRMGYELRFESQSVVYHVGGGTLSYESPRKTFLNFRNSLLMIHKNHIKNVWWMIFRRLFLDGLAGIRFLAQGKVKHFWAVFTSHFAFYNMLSSSRVERKKYKHFTNEAIQGRYHGSVMWATMIQKVKEFSKLNQRRIH